jgi:hypothetical protein
MDKTEPHTEKQPLTHHAYGTCSGWRAQIPLGKGIPMKKESGANTRRIVTILKGNSTPKNEWIIKERLTPIHRRENPKKRNPFFHEIFWEV